MGIFGFKGSFGTGIALSGEPKTAINIWQRRVAELSAAKAAAKERAAKEEEKALDMVNDFIIKDPRKYTKFYQPLVTQTYSEGVNQLYKMKKEHPNTWTNMVTGVVVGMKEKLDNLANNSQNQRDVEKMALEGYLVPDSLLSTLNDPKNYGNIDALKALNEEMALYGGGVHEDGSFSLWPAKPFDAQKQISEFNRDDAKFTKEFNTGTLKSSGIVEYHKKFTAPQETIDAYKMAMKTDQDFRVTTAAKYSDVLLSIKDPAQRDIKLNELMDVELQNLGKREDDAILMNRGRSSSGADSPSKQKFDIEGVVPVQYTRMPKITIDIPTLRPGETGWYSTILKANGNVAPGGWDDVFDPKGRIIADIGESFSLKNIKGDLLGYPGKRIFAVGEVVRGNSGEKKAIIKNLFVENEGSGYSMSTVASANTLTEKGVPLDESMFKGGKLFISADDPNKKVSYGEMLKNIGDMNAVVTEFRQDDNGDISARAVFNNKNNQKESWWVPYSTLLGNAVMQQNKFWWGGKRADEWLEQVTGINKYKSGSSKSATPVATPIQKTVSSGKKKSNGAFLTQRAKKVQQ